MSSPWSIDIENCEDDSDDTTTLMHHATKKNAGNRTINLRQYFTFNSASKKETFCFPQYVTDINLGLKSRTIGWLCLKYKRTVQPTFMLSLGKKSVIITCPSCRTPMGTRIVYQITPLAFFLSCLMGPLVLCWVPYCVQKRKIVRHFCSVCEAYIGSSY